MSVTADAKCGLGILLSDGADAQCFSQAGNVNPAGQQQPKLPSSGAFDSIGCWTDSASARTLTGGSVGGTSLAIRYSTRPRTFQPRPPSGMVSDCYPLVRLGISPLAAYIPRQGTNAQSEARCRRRAVYLRAIRA